MELFDKPVSFLVNKTHSGELTCKQLVTDTLQQVQEKDTSINSFISLCPEQAIQHAESLDQMPPDHKAQKPLLGVPIAVKDNICTSDAATTCASKMLETFNPPYDATVVQLLQDAGAVIIGKTNCDEFAMGASTEMSAYGPTRNPRDPDYVPGGSSGGSAAAVAAGFVPLALGSDTGGSIRQPASHCGIYGLKPTYGRVSRYGLVAFASSLDQIGPFANNVRDMGLILSVIARNDPKDATCVGKPFINDDSLYGESLKGMKIGIPQEYFGEGLADSVRKTCLDCIQNLKAQGVTFIDVSLPTLTYAVATYYIICTAEASSNLARYDGVKYGYRSPNAESIDAMYRKTREEGFGTEVKRRIMLGTYVLSSGYYDAYYLKAAKVRTLIQNNFTEIFSKCDAVISPVAPTPAFRFEEKCHDPLQMYLMDIYTVSANLAGIPGISIPYGTDGKLPIGVQFMAPHWKEDTLIRLAHRIQTTLQ